MAVTSITELDGDRSGSANNKRSRRYTRQFAVRTSSKLDGPAVVIAYLSLPQVYDAYASGNDADSAALAEAIDVKQDGLCRFIATITYSTATPDANQNAENPVDRSPVVRWSFATYQVPVLRDVGGVAMANSSGEPFDPPVEREEKRAVLTVERYESTFSPALALAYQYAVNSDTFMGAEPGLSRCNGIEAERHYEKGYYCWRVKYEFEFRAESYQARVLDQGYSRLDATGKRTPIMVKGSPPSSPVLLNGAGIPLETCTTLLAAAATDVDQFIEVDDIDVFPDAPFRVQIGDEILYVGNKEDIAPNPILSNLVRGYEGTVAAAHADNDEVFMLPVYLERTIYRSLPFAALNLLI